MPRNDWHFSPCMRGRTLTLVCMHIHACTAWCNENRSLASLDAPDFHAANDVRDPISLHQAVDTKTRMHTCMHTQKKKKKDDDLLKQQQQKETVVVPAHWMKFFFFFEKFADWRCSQKKRKKNTLAMLCIKHLITLHHS